MHLEIYSGCDRRDEEWQRPEGWGVITASLFPVITHSPQGRFRSSDSPQQTVRLIVFSNEAEHHEEGLEEDVVSAQAIASL